MRRTVTVIAAVVAALAFTQPAAAQQYPPETGELVVSDSTVSSGGTVTVSGDGCAPGSTVSVTVDGSAAGTTTADATGAFSTQVQITGGAGPHTVEATCPTPDGATRVLSAVITVVAAGGLATTGSDSTVPTALLGAAMVVVGVALVAVVRRRRARIAA